MSEIVIRGASEHNLRDISLELPRGKLICFTGVSGSGKSSLAFDTLYAEGQRRYVESLSSYARQFLGQMPKPQVERIDGLSPAIAIQQKTAGRNPRSTVGTITEIHDYLRVLFARVGRQHCPSCGRLVEAQTREQIVARILALPANTAFTLLAPVVRGQKGEHKDLFDELIRAGFVRARVDGQILPISDQLTLDRQIKHDIEVVIDRLKAVPGSRARLAEAVETALIRGENTVIVAVEGQPDLVLSSQYACPSCGIGFDAPTPQLFSFNSPQGMCPGCDGLGTRHELDPDRLVPNPELSVWDGAIEPLGPVKKLGRWRRHIFEGVAANIETDPDGPKPGTMLKGPWKDLPQTARDAWLFGTGDRAIVHRWKTRNRNWVHSEKWPGIATEYLAKIRNGAGGPLRAMLEPLMRQLPCTECGGARLNARARAVRVGGRSLTELEAWTIGDAAEWFAALAGQATAETSHVPPPEPLDAFSALVAEELLKEIRGRLGFLVNVGLHYLTLDRPAPTLSGGEAQRIRLASQVGAGLVGVLYILDEPSIGLHARDNDRLIETLQRLRDAGNTVIVVEHDEDTMRAADFLVDFGPGPGIRGGEVVAQGTIADLAGTPASVTGGYLAGTRTIASPDARKAPNGRALRVVNARHHNLKEINVDIPLGLFVAVTGVSGSGKSSLINDIVRVALARDLNGAQGEPGAHDRIEGVDLLDKVIDIDQSPIGRTPRSNPATYIKLLDEIRNLYTKLPDSRARGYKPGRFSFNVPGGRCEACEGNGSNKLEMDFLADVWVTCPVCEGKRFNRETQHIRFKGKSISDVLEMDVQEALEHFANVPKIAGMLQTLHDVGLDYIKLGQPSPTLSGGEAQRIKLAKELVRRSTGKTLYILDEPTTGLHFEDVRRLLDVLQGFTATGNSVVVIEHNLDVIKTADWIIDLGPEGGAGGGRIVAQGTPEEIAQNPTSFTGQALARHLRSQPVIASKTRSRRAKTRRNAHSQTAGPIVIRGASQHNLKAVDVDLPRHQLTVCSGPSGSGKSSLAIDTLYAEGQRRYVESLSSYARQFLSPLQKPKVEQISGLAPAISIEQKTTSKSPRSTVGTVTEIHDYLRILFARLGQPHCPRCGIPIGTQSADEIVEKILRHPEGSRVYVMAPIERREGEAYEHLWEDLRASGFNRVRVDGKTVSLDEPITLSARRKHRVEVVIDRITVRRASRSRLADSIESALDLGRGVVHVARVEDDAPEPRWAVERFSQHRSCDQCGRSFEELSPNHFSFNSPLGWCPSCVGLGVQPGADPAALIPDGRLSLRQGAIVAWPGFGQNPLFQAMIETLAQTRGIDLDCPFDDLETRQRRALLHGTGGDWYQLPPTAEMPGFSFQFKGLFPAIEEAGRLSFLYRMKLSGMVDEVECATCMGARLRDDAAAVRIKGNTLDQISRWPLGRVLEFFQKLRLTADERHIAGDLIREIRDRLTFLVDVGLDYLALARGTPTLSGGEAQRIRLASQLGSGLTGVLYVLDEPTIGLHPRDNGRLLRALQRLRDLGNTLVVVEHDREVIESADYLVDFGPGSGAGGGRITAKGTPAKVKSSRDSLTGRYLGGREAIPVPSNRRSTEGAAIEIEGARQHNLQNISARFPVGALTVVTGVSGSGKSSLVEDVLYRAAAKQLQHASQTPGAHDRVLGLSHVDKVIVVDQTPIGSTPNSNPATYAGLFDSVRSLYARLPESRMRGYTPGRFSFNVAGGRCEACEGAGQRRIEMHFLPDVWVDCEACGGSRYTRETLEPRFKGKSIADVLRMTTDEALEIFEGIPKLRRILQTLHDVGLGYVPLGQAAPTLSGGEAQRVKLAAELARPDTGRTLYILDEPTTGLHMDDVRKLLDVLQRLADLGNTVVVIEHNLDVIKSADWIVDLGPEAGIRGGRLVAQGSPETIADCNESHTGAFLKTVLAESPRVERPRFDPRAAARQARAKATGSAPAVEAATQTPWERDGRRWHTQDRTTRSGKFIRWEGTLLARVIDRIESLGCTRPIDWSRRTLVRIPGPTADAPDFFEAVTGQEWVLTLRFRLPQTRFRLADLESRLALRPFADCAPPVLSDAPRIRVRPLSGGGQEIELFCHSAAELDIPAFDDFLGTTVAATLGQPEGNGNPAAAPGWKVVTKSSGVPKKKSSKRKPSSK